MRCKTPAVESFPQRAFFMNQASFMNQAFFMDRTDIGPTILMTFPALPALFPSAV